MGWRRDAAVTRRRDACATREHRAPARPGWKLNVPSWCSTLLLRTVLVGFKLTCKSDRAGLDFARMYPPVVTKDPTAVEVEVQSAYLGMFPKGEAAFVPRVFGWAIECFTGKYRDYQAVDARYHDFEHTLQGTLCFARLLHGRHRAKAKPLLTQRMFELGLLAILMHDTGYLKQRGDTEGTGAKYTVTHVDRSADFAAQL